MLGKNMCVIGGDLRFKSLAAYFAADGYNTELFGFNEKCVYECYNACANADIIVLPIPVSNDLIKINSPFSNETIYIDDILRSAKKTSFIVGGKIGRELSERSSLYGLTIHDYMARDELAIYNAIPTAEGAIETAMAELPITIWGSNALVCGYGRIGKLLSKMLHSMGANVSVAARKSSDEAWIGVNGCTPVKYDDLPHLVHKFDVIFNTVPTNIIDGDILERCRNDILIIDLASKPGGVDMVAASELNKKVIWSLSLPGKVAPITASKFIKRTIENMLCDRGIIVCSKE